MQRIFEEYKQPFALTYFGVSVMAIYFPISVLKNWICRLLNIFFRKIQGDYISVRTDGILQRPETGLKSSLIDDNDIREREEGTSLVKKEKDETPLIAQSNESSSWKIAKCGLYLTPIWFAQEVIISHLVFLFYFCG